MIKLSTMVAAAIGYVLVAGGLIGFKEALQIKRHHERTMPLRIENREGFSNVMHTFNAEAEAKFECAVYEAHNEWYIDHWVTNVVNRMTTIGITVWKDPPSGCKDPVK